MTRWWVVAVFAIAMAWVESAVVFDLRTLIGRIEPHQPDPLPVTGALELVEVVREVATMVMLIAAGMLAGRTWRQRFGYTLVAFGLWDIFYYVFLRVTCGWPRSLLDWDILFLLPLPWWGPVLAPVLIALLMIAWGTLASQFERAQSPRRVQAMVWASNLAGVALALYTFMADSLRVAGQGADAVRHVLPSRFEWLLFGAALLLMSAPVVETLGAIRLRANRRCAHPAAEMSGSSELTV